MEKSVTASSIGQKNISSHRTSKEIKCNHSEIPSVISKITQLLDCSSNKVEYGKIIKYEKGEYFLPHIDVVDGLNSRPELGFYDSTRLVSLITYLNDVEKLWRKLIFVDLNLSIKPKKGSLCLHFPATLDYKQDSRTLHEGYVAVDDKWIFVTWMWKDDKILK